MKISYNWLKSYINTDLSPEQISEILTDTGLEVEKLEIFEPIPGGLKGVVVGLIEDLWPHPNADKLNITTVDIGEESPVQIVCGAPNAAKGQKVLVATVGTTLQPRSEKAFKIKKAKIRGEVSLGMICAEDELGIGKGHDGILILPEEAPVGMPAAELLNIQSDSVFEIGLTPNRTDAMGHIGVARDLAARLSLEKPTQISIPKVPLRKEDPNTTPRINVEIHDAEGCGRYTGISIENIKVEPAPVWMQNYLLAIGQTPINNVVDTANFVMFETGQPLHAFDADTIKGGKINVQTLPGGTKFKTLDGVERLLHPSDLMICDEKGGLCIAGVLGGIGSGVTEHTTNIFLESAWFNPVRIRKTAKRHGLNTDASFRFERGADPQNTRYALQRAAALIEELAHATTRDSILEKVANIPEQVVLDFSTKRFNTLAGTSLSIPKIKRILHSLDFEITTEKAEVLTLKVPTYRVDVTREVDVIEEVLRIYGYNAVEIPDQMRISLSAEAKPTRSDVVRTLRSSLMGRGFNEMISNGLTHSHALKVIGGERIERDLISLLNPLSNELDILRPNLAVSVLEAVAYNVNRQADRLRLFEFGTVYRKVENGYQEATHLALALLGNRFVENWNNPAIAVGLSDLRGAVQSVFQILGLQVKFGDPAENPFYAEAVELLLKNKRLGTMGRISAKAAKQFGIKRDVWLAEFDFDTCFRAIVHADKYVNGLPKFPAVSRDFSLLLNKNIGFGEIENIAYAKAGKHLLDVILFDVYEGKNLPEGKKSYAVRFILQDENKTLNDKQIDKDMAAIQHELESALSAQLR